MAVPLCLPVSGGGTDLHAGRASRGRAERAVSYQPTAPASVRAERPPPARGPVREIVLSFDDGPDLEGTPLVLDELDRRGLKGIFFVNGSHLVGDRAQDLVRRDLVRRLASHGHMVANHGLSHKNLCLAPEALEEEIDGNAEIITHATGVRPALFRSPYGARCRNLERALSARELTSVGWDLDPQDWNRGRRKRRFASGALDGPEQEERMLRHVVRSLGRLRGRAILLLHDTQPHTVRVLPRILAFIDRENARVAREGGAPIRIRDYSIFFPERPLPETGARALVADLSGSLSILPGLSLAAARFGLR